MIPPQARFSRNFFSYTLIVLLGISLWLVFLVARPYLNTLFLAAVFAAICYPVFQRLLRATKDRRIPSALATVLLAVICIGVPLTAFFAQLIPQIAQTAVKATQWMLEGGLLHIQERLPLEPLLEWLDEALPFVDLDQIDIQGTLLGLTRQLGQYALKAGSVFLTNMAHYVLHFFLFSLAMFFFVKDGGRMIAQIKLLSPLRSEQEDRILNSFRRVGRAVLVGGVLVAIIQGVLGGIGMWLAGYPGLFSGTLMACASFVPLLGTGLIWLPSALYLVLMGEWWMGSFLFLWGAVIVAGADSLLRPYFMRGSSGLPVFFIFFAILGGLQAFGPIGVAYGPLILGFAMVMLDLYREEYGDVLKPDLSKAEPSAPGPSEPGQSGPGQSGPGQSEPMQAESAQPGLPAPEEITASQPAAHSKEE